ncbi:MAG: 30S ribosomal protein S9 [Candidatus Sungbacteria bacterium]|nr:30S ribosomal protein S9 [Candidatus Sungbacteria bacterium]
MPKAIKKKIESKPVEKEAETPKKKVEEKENKIKTAVKVKKPSKQGAEVPAQEISSGFSEHKTDKAEKPKKPERYFEAVGRRKTAVARVRLFTRPGDFTVNGRLYSLYFPTLTLQQIIEDSLKKMKLLGRFRVSIKVSGGGTHAQAEAIRHGLARCLVKFNPDFRKRLRRAGYITRDPRAKERKKFGLKKARKAPQWAKR